MFFTRVRVQRNRLAKYLLRHWLYYDQHMGALSEIEQRNMRMLYAGLKILTKQEIMLLAEKYRVESGPTITDVTAADMRGVDVKEYKVERLLIEDKLQDEISKYYDHSQ